MLIVFYKVVCLIMKFIQFDLISVRFILGVANIKSVLENFNNSFFKRDCQTSWKRLPLILNLEQSKLTVTLGAVI